MNGSWRPIMAPSTGGGQAGDGAQRGDRRAQGAEGHRGGVEDQGEDQGVERLEAQGDEQGAGDGHRGAEAGDAFEQTAEAEADDDQHDAPVVGQVLDDPAAEGVEAAAETTATL